ncbi:MAG: hypothetical protein M3256_20050, partial [Actinomycetota bacterium]|nr:hypothetical protein [Actinomycetota bacterium]
MTVGGKGIGVAVSNRRPWWPPARTHSAVAMCGMVIRRSVADTAQIDRSGALATVRVPAHGPCVTHRPAGIWG